MKLNETLNQLACKQFCLSGLLESWIKNTTYSTYSTEDNRGCWLIKVLVHCLSVASDLETKV